MCDCGIGTRKLRAASAGSLVQTLQLSARLSSLEEMRHIAESSFVTVVISGMVQVASDSDLSNMSSSKEQ